VNTLFFDTETTGKAEFRLPHNHATQPRIVQIGAILMDGKHEVRGELNVIIKPNGWTIPPDVAAIHGITQEIADEFGVGHGLALQMFDELAAQADVYVAHNFSFDDFVLQVATAKEEAFILNLSYLKDHSYCTMLATTDICQLPGNYGKFKWPKLQEAHQHAFGEPFEGAHDAMADVRACARLYRWLKEREAKSA
jgi:DNA polymerase-3 subunit epsilon